MSIEITVQDGNGEIDVTVSGGGAGRPSVSDSGTLVLSGPADLDFDANLSVFDDGDGTVSIDAASGSGFPTVEDDGVVVVSGADGLNFADNLTVADDGDGSVTIDATSGGTDTRTDVSDSGGTVVSDVKDITFTASADASITVSDDADGTATVDVSATDTNTDTRTDIEDSGAAVLSNVTSINFANNVTVTDDGDGSVTVDVSGSQPDAEDDGTVIVSGSSAFNFGTDLSVTDDGDGTVTVDSTASGGSALTVQDDGVDVETDTDTLDMQTDFAVTNPTTGEAEVALDSNQVTVAGNTVSLGGSTTIAVGNLSDVDTATLNAGELLIYDATAGQFENADITAGNALTATTGDATLTLAVASNSIDSDELVTDSLTYNGVTASLGGTATLSLRDLRVTTSVSAATTTNGEDTVFVDSAGTGGVTVTLGSGDAVAGQEITIQDTGGAASSNTITVDTEGSETFADGDSAKTITADRGWLTARWDGSQWVSDRYQQVDQLDATAVSTDDLGVGNVGTRARLSANQTITSGTITKVQLDTTDYDDAGEFDTTNNEFVADNAGTYIVCCSAFHDSIADQTRVVTRFSVNGSAQSQVDTVTSGNRNTTQAFDAIQLSAGDTLSMEVFQNSGGDQTLVANENKTYFTVTQVG